MQMVMRTLGILLILLTATVLFAPKKELYYALEHRLARHGLILAGESLSTGPNSLEIRQAQILYEGAPIATLGRLKITTWLFYTTAELEKLQPLPGMERFLPLSIEKGRAVHAIWHPTRIRLELEGSFGHAAGSLDLLRRQLRIESPTAGKIEAIRPYLKNEEGRWVYESQL